MSVPIRTSADSGPDALGCFFDYDDTTAVPYVPISEVAIIVEVAGD